MEGVRKTLNKAEEAEYKFLKREVDKWYDELIGLTPTQMSKQIFG